MSETTSAKEMDDRERFRPSNYEIIEKRIELMEIFSFDDAAEATAEWIEAETERRMAEDYADKLPFRRGKK